MLGSRLSKEERLAQYKDGSILRIQLKNFLTYAAVEFRPGPRLNVVMGPNGTGKSTILCAICLGLGGQPPLLGRADDARTFIKNDEDVAEIEIELAPVKKDEKGNPIHNPRHDILRRVIDRNKGSERGRGIAASTYYINGTVSNLKAVQKLVSEKYKIAIDNLCTFLPQDRVGSFSGFDSKMLLKETEKSISASQHLYATHEKLIELEKDILDGDTNLQTIQDQFEKLQNEVNQLEREKELMQEREEHMKQLHLLKQKLAWVKFEAKRLQAVELKEQKKELKKQLTNARSQIAPIEEEIGGIEEELARNTARKRALAKVTKNAFRQFSAEMEKADQYEDKIEVLQVDINEIDSLQNRAKMKVDELQRKYEQSQSILNACAPEQDLVEAHRSAHQQQREIRDKMKIVKNELHRYQDMYKEKCDGLTLAQQRLDSFRDEKGRRNEKILSSDRYLQAAFGWLDENRKMFRHRVWGPIVCEITTNDTSASNCLEQHVKNSVLKSFVCESDEDYNLLFREVREKRKIPINIQVVKQGRLETVRRKYSDSKMQVLKRDHGVQGYLDEVFSAPDAVVQALRNTSNIQSVLIGNDKTTKSLNDHNLMDYLNQRENGNGLQAACIFAKNGQKTYKYTSIISRYSGKASLSVDEISPARMLKPGVPPEVRERAENIVDELKQECLELQPKMQDTERRHLALQTEGQEAHAKMKDAQKGKQELEDAKVKVSAAKRRLRAAEAELSNDTVAEKKEKKQQIKHGVKKVLDSVQQASLKYDEFLKATTEAAGLELSEEGKQQSLRNLQMLLDDIMIQNKTLEEQFTEISQRFNMEKRDLAKLQADAIAIAPLNDENGETLPLRAKLDELPDNITEIHEAMDSAKEKISSIHDNPEVMRRYERQKLQLGVVKEELQDMKESKHLKRTELENMKVPWESSLTNLVSEASKLFSAYMKELGCAGEVCLSKGDEPTRGRNEHPQENLGNFKEWGIQIRVKFREKADLQTLSAQVHSGGERSVSTIMYLMAMQNMMVSPFRCVDEINQGLDERNERLVFKRIVQNSTQPPDEASDPTSHCGQYFLITPKLLPNLTDMENENVTLQVIFNGPFNFKHFSDFNIDNFLKEKRRFEREKTSCDGKENETSATDENERRTKRIKSNEYD